MNLPEPKRPYGVCQCEPELPFCSDCPDHEACSTGVPEHLVRAQREIPGVYWPSVKKGSER